jgi:hypothetical protein
MRFSDGFAAPILWGVKEGYTPAEIAAGLELEEATVRAVMHDKLDVAHRLKLLKAPAPKLPRVRLAMPARIDPERRDPAYLSWANAQRGARARQREIAAEAMGAGQAT